MGHGATGHSTHGKRRPVNIDAAGLSRCHSVAKFAGCISVGVDRSKRPLQWADLAEGRLCLDRLWLNGAGPLSSPAGCAAIPRETKKVSRHHPPPCFGPAGEPSVASGLSIAIEAAMVRARTQSKRRNIMATIGTFKKSGTEYTGEIVTLNVQAKNVRIVPETSQTSENAPSHRVLVGRAEIGAAWSKQSNEGRDYLGLKLDDPSFTAPIYANLFDDEEGEGFSLIWSRPNRRNGD